MERRIKGIIMLLISATLVVSVITVAIMGRKGPNRSVHGLIIGTVLFLLTGFATGLITALLLNLSYSMTTTFSVIGLSLGLVGWLFLRYTTPNNISKALGVGILITWIICTSCSMVLSFAKGLSYLMDENSLL